MGWMRIECLTADPAQTTLYGFVYGYSSDKEKGKSRWGDVMILIKSQANPSNTSDIQRSPVSTFPTSTWLTPMIAQTFPQLSCTVNSAGVFTVLSYDKFDGSAPTLKGIRYNPVRQMGPMYNVTGGGVWSTVDVSSRYNLTETPPSYRPVMFYVKEGEKETLAYAFTTLIGPKYEPAIQLGYVNENASPPVLEPSTLYKNDDLKVADMDINLTEMGTCMRTLPDLSHAQNDSEKYDPQLDTISSTLTDKKTTTVMRCSERIENIVTTSFFQPIGGHLPGQEAFAVISLRTEIQGITLTGPSAGTRQDIIDVYIDGIYGDGIRDPNSGSVQVQDGKSPLSSTEWGFIIAAIVLVALVASLLVLRRVHQRRKKSMDKLELEYEDMSKSEQGDSDANGTQLKDVKTRRTDTPIGTGKFDEAEVDGTVPLTLTGFSTHPRPNVTTCLGSSSP